MNQPDRPARDAVYAELMWPERNPTSESYGTGAEKANALLDALEAEARATGSATQPTADRAAEEVAKHVTRAIFALKTPSPDGSTHYQSGWDDGLEAAMDAARDAVLAVLPEPVDRAAVRAEALGEGADAVAADRTATIPVHTAWARGMTRAEELLRRLAGEPPASEARPPRHAWRVKTRDPLADEWVAGSHFASRPHAVDRWETANRNAPKWRDGTPVERRIVRETTTFTVEQPPSV
ncbi:hypothetical protein ACWDUC_14255 [Streptomyces tricolor]